MELCLIWAQDRTGAVGRQDGHPWLVPEDRRHFRETTMGSPVIMGRRTWQAIGGQALPGRQNIVLMREGDLFEAIGAVRSCSIGDAIMLAGSSRPAKAFIIGGADLHARALPVAQRVYVTEMDMELDLPAVYAPQLHSTQWSRHVESSLQVSRQGIRFRFIEYRRAGRR